MSEFGGLFDGIDRPVRAALGRALDGAEVSVADALLLAEATGRELQALALVADELRARQAGEIVTYVVNRNINFTNVCIKHCTFCAFSRDYREEEGYFLPVEEVVCRAREAWELGATEVCIQAGLPPKLDGRFYIDLCHAIKRELPDLHIHAFSPEEVLYGTTRSGLSIREYLAELRAAGLGTLPGTSAEILDDELRNVISKGRISTRQWLEVITTAHGLGIRTTSTIMYGHIETPAHWVRHMALLRDVQKDTGGFTEFVPLSLVHQEAPMYRRGLVAATRPGATGAEVVRMHALARLMLGATFGNVQASWVKEGPKLAQMLLASGANDLGGTLINESISTSAGAPYGQLVPPAELRRLVRDLGRIPAQRTTTYDILKVYADETEDEPGPLDAVDDPEVRFGSYRRLTAAKEFRFAHPMATGSRATVGYSPKGDAPRPAPQGT
ncbi:MAG: 5-amino-6-(D-ribitylamino)uracil--L-tyrosine 4-hydroxyphenyl transferase CofH [Candidatus Rokubacteria bacterium]|nr:5-amino-6-(D-ribitylamino)uracil--L-tyrosine 4-hydroxyphenyl transferase CofH [Candidatus Rokubacteria bacterium]